ncbi:unnamed protein product [Ectocarpus sp. CCAP 1310/34]|nr:unnamed protein product [Ectocarpus sp. CCAP 1310/34]
MSSAGDEERAAASGEQIRPPVQEGRDAELASLQRQISQLAALVEESVKKKEPGSVVATAASSGGWVAAPRGHREEPTLPLVGGGEQYPRGRLKPAVYKVKRTQKSEPKAQKCFYLGPGINTNRDCVRILNEKRQEITTHNFTWQPVPAAPAALPQSLPPIAEEEEEFATEEDEVGEGRSSQGGGRAEGEPVDGGPGFTLGTTAVPGPAVPPARVAPAAPPAAPRESGAGDTGNGAPSSREGASVAPSTTSTGTADVGGGEDDRRSSGSGGSGGSSGDDGGSGGSSGSDSETDPPALSGPEARRLARFDKPTELTSRRTRENPRRNPRYESPPSPTSAEALLASVASLPVSSTEEFTRWMLSAVLHVAEGLEARVVRELLSERAQEAHAARQEAEDFLLGTVDLMLNSPDAFETALTSHEQNGAPEGRRPVSSKWCFSWKTDKEGKIDTLKARLVARGFSQVPNVDYFHSSSPCPSSAFIKLMLAVANLKGMNLHHWDVKKAYTHGTLDEEHDVGVDVLASDVSFAVRAVARHAHAPAKRHWDAVQKILGYLKGTRDLGITYQRGSGLGLAVYVDASYADTEDRRSVSGLVTTVGGTVVSHGRKTQSIVSLSSTEAEYIAAGEGVKEALFVRAVLSFVAPETSGSSIRVLEDNQGAIALVQNPLSSGRTKHIDVRFHFIRGLFGSGDISVKLVPTTEQHADLLTKALSRASLQRNGGGRLPREPLPCVSSMENVRRGLLRHFSFVVDAVKNERCSTHAIEDTEAQVVATLGYNATCLVRGEDEARRLLDELAADPAKAKLWYDTSSGDPMDPSQPTTEAPGVSMVSRTSVPHVADLLRDQNVNAVVRVSMITPLSEYSHLVALGPDGFFLCTCLRQLVYGLLCPHGLEALWAEGVVSFNGAIISPRWRESETPWLMAELAAKPASLSARAATSAGLPAGVGQPPRVDPNSTVSRSGPNVPSYTYANGVALGKKLGGMFKEINNLAGIHRAMETIKLFARGQVDLDKRSQEKHSTNRVFRGVFSQPAEDVPSGDAGGTGRGPGRGGRSGGGERGATGMGGRGGRSQGRAARGGATGVRTPGPGARDSSSHPPAAVGGAVPLVSGAHTLQGAGMPLGSLSNVAVPGGAGRQPLALDQEQAPPVLRQRGRSKRHESSAAGGR